MTRIHLIFHKYPALLCVVPIILGVCSGYFILDSIVLTNPFISITFQFLLLLGCIYVYRINKKSLKAYILLFVLTLIFGLIRFDYVYHSTHKNDVSEMINLYSGKDVKIYGSVIDQPDENENRLKLILDSDSIVSYSGARIVSGDVMITAYKTSYSRRTFGKFSFGDFVEVSGDLEPLPHRRNPGEFDYGEYLRLHGIKAAFSTFGLDKLKLVGKSSGNYFQSKIIYPVRQYSLSRIDEYMGSDEGEFMKGLVLGERSNISKEIKENFVNDGISHIIAVSGLNVAYVMIIIGLFLQLFPIKNLFKVLVTILALLFYMNLTGNVPSIIRATIMASVLLLSTVVERKSVPLNTISVAALIILIVDPRQLFDAGFILSFWAILSLVMIYPKLDGMLKNSPFFARIEDDGFFSKGLRALLFLIVGTLAAQIGTLPITAIMFKKISLVSLVTNMIAIPVSNLGMAMGFIMILVSLISNWMAAAIGLSSSLLLNLLLRFIDFFAKLKYSFIETYNLDILFLICFYAVVIILLFIPRMKLLSRLVLSILLISNYLLVEGLLNATDRTTFAYLDVGNSNACIVTTPLGKNILVNTGTSSPKFSSAENTIIPYLKLRGVDQIDHLVLTSMNKNEFRNVIKLLKNFPVSGMSLSEFYRPVLEDSFFKPYFNSVEKFYVKDTAVNEFDELIIKQTRDQWVRKLNHLSLSCGNQLFVFVDGEISYLQIGYILNPPPSYETAILRVPSSGSFALSPPEMIAAFEPRKILISSRRNRKNLNSDIFVYTMKNFGYEVDKISEKGAFIFRSDGKVTERINW